MEMQIALIQTGSQRTLFLGMDGQMVYIPQVDKGTRQNTYGWGKGLARKKESIVPLGKWRSRGWMR